MVQTFRSETYQNLAAIIAWINHAGTENLVGENLVCENLSCENLVAENVVYGKSSVRKIQCGENLEARKFSGWKVQWLYKQNIQWQIAGHAEDGEKQGMDFVEVPFQPEFSIQNL